MLNHIKALSTTLQSPLTYTDSLAYHRDKASFITSHPTYPSAALSSLRKREFSRLDQQVYLDYTGSSLYPRSLITSHFSHLRKSVLGNPHSTSPASLLSSSSAEEARRAVLTFFDADEAEYDVVWTNNASGGLKIIGETYSWKDRKVVLPRDAHNSVNSLARRAEAGGGGFEFVECNPEGLIPRSTYVDVLSKPGTADGKKGKGLVFFTGQSNITGVKLDMDLIGLAKSLGWDVGLDAAALAPSTRISLRTHKVDFMVVSLYKICGYPTGLGALILRKAQYAQMDQKQTFFGGNIVGITMDRMEFTLVDGPERFEDGTGNFVSLSAVKPGLEFAARWMEEVNVRNRLLLEWLVEQLDGIYYPANRTSEVDHDEKRLSSSSSGTATSSANSHPVKLIEIGGPSLTATSRGFTLPLVFSSPSNHALNYRFVIWAAAQDRISLRGGPCMCNPGASSSVMHRGLITNLVASTLLADADVGIVRVSLGTATNFKDLWRLVHFARRLTDQSWVERMWAQYESKNPGARLSNDIDALHALATGQR